MTSSPGVPTIVTASPPHVSPGFLRIGGNPCLRGISHHKGAEQSGWQGHETDRQLHRILQVSNKDELSLISLRSVPPILTIARRKSITNVT